MKNHLVAIAVLGFSCLLLHPVDAGWLSWLAGKLNIPGYGEGNKTTSNTLNDNFNYGSNYVGSQGYITFGSTFGSGTRIESFGSVFRVRVQQHRGKDGACDEEITIVLQKEKNKENTLHTKCSKDGASKTIRNEADLILIGNPGDEFIVFTTNIKEIYYLQDGKWKKGDFSGDNTKDKDLTPSEIAEVKERIKKWQAFFDQTDKEMQKFRDLRRVEKEKSVVQRQKLKDLGKQEKQKHKEINDHIKQLRSDEKANQKAEKKKIDDLRKVEGWSTTVEKLYAEENIRQQLRDAELYEMERKEIQRYYSEYNKNIAMIEEEYIKYDREIENLYALERKENERVLQELKQNIANGW